MHERHAVSEDSSSKVQSSGRHYVDIPLVIFLGMILMLGLAMIYSTSSYRALELYGDKMYFFKRQLVYMLLAISASVVVSGIDYRHYLRYAKLILIMSIALQILVLVIGRASHGSARWLYIGPIGFQPSEYAKLAITIYAAAYASLHSGQLFRLGFLIKTMSLPVLTIVLIGVENLSTAIICFGILCVVLFVGSPKVRHFVLIGVIGMIGCALFILFAGYRANRVKIWLAPEKYPDGYQTVQSLYAVGSGGLFGLGFGESIQKQGFIPESHNDMIFSVVCEELGLVGACLILAVFIALLYRMALIAMNASDRFGCYLVAGAMAHIAVQLLINAGVVTNTIPPTGVPMPLISYGGSSIIFILIEMGIVMSVAKARTNTS